MVKYEFMGAHGRGSENKGAAKHKVGGDAKKKRVAKKMWCTHPPACVRLWEHTQTDADICMGIIYYINGIKLSASVYNFRIQTPKGSKIKSVIEFFSESKNNPWKIFINPMKSLRWNFKTKSTAIMDLFSCNKGRQHLYRNFGFRSNVF